MGKEHDMNSINKEILDELINLYKQEKNFLHRSDRGLLRSILNPATEKIKERVPDTLARDLKFLVSKGYDVEEVQPVDMFAQTYHVETVVLMSRVDK